MPKMLGLCEAENGTEVDELLQAGASGHKRARQDVKNEHRFQKVAGFPAQKARNWKIERQKKRITRKEYKRLLNEFEMGGFMAQKGLWNLAR